MAKRGRTLFRVLLVALLCAASLHSFARPAQARTFTVCPSGCDVTTILGTVDASVIRVRARANVRIEAVTITGSGGSATGSGSAGGGILNEGGLSLFDSVVRGNQVANGEGGGIFSRSSKTLKIGDSVVSGNQAIDGGGISIFGGDVVIEGTTITGNHSTQNGGGINHQGGETLRLERCNITNNRSDLNVGGVLSSSELLLIDSTVSGNSASVGGLAGGRERLKIVRGAIHHNTSRGSGGGIRVGSGGATLIDSRVEANRSTAANGAGIFTTTNADDVTLKNSTITGNIAAQDGGGILNESAESELDNSRIIDNRAGRLGTASTLGPRGRAWCKC